MGRIFTLSLLFFFLFFTILLNSNWNCTWAYVHNLSAAGIPIRWKSPVKLNLVGNPINQSSLASSDFYHAVVTGLQRWKAASQGVIDFDYWQGMTPTMYPANSEYNGISSIYFASNAKGTVPELSPHVLGMTQVWYNTTSRETLEVDIILNDKNFYFTNNPTDTSGFGAKSTQFTDNKGNVYIQNVVTHELGHSLGLSHSGELQSTMLFMESPEQAHLGCDELTGIHALYPSDSLNSRGSLQGKVISEQGAPIFGAHVLAISQRRGTVLASALSNKVGVFEMTSLEPGEYFLIAEPFYAGPQALPEYYSEATLSTCSNGIPFGRSFLTQEDGMTLTGVSVTSAKTTPTPPITVHCNKSGGASLIQNSHESRSLYVPILNATHESGFGVVDRIQYSQTNDYRLLAISGRLEIHALGYSLYSPVHPSLALLDSNGRPINTETIDPIYVGDSGYINRNSALIADHLPFGDYLLQVSATRVLPHSYPAGLISLDSVSFIILSGSLNENAPALSSVIPVNARCQISETFPPYSSPADPPPHPQGQTKEEKTGFCGLIENTSESTSKDSDKFSTPSSGPSSRMSPMTKISWLLPWLLMLTFAKLLRPHARTVTLKE